MGAAGRDFHNFNVYFRDNPDYEVVAFTATQIPDIEGRIYPPQLTGKLYPEGLPIYPEDDLQELILKFQIEEVVFSYSDISHIELMHKASLVLSAGADFTLLGPQHTMLTPRIPLVSIGAVRTGVGKSQTTRRVCEIFKKKGFKLAVIRHPMPYGDIKEQICQKFSKMEDLDRHNCTIEEREEYAPHIEAGNVVYAGVDYGIILEEAQKDVDILIWDGGNNDFPFYRTDLHIVLVDPHRPGHEVLYHPGEANLRMADIVIINKVDTAERANLELVKENIKRVNPTTAIIEAASPITIEGGGEALVGKSVLVVEDGPTLTHGEMKYGAGYIAATQKLKAKVINPSPYAKGSIKEVYKKYPHLEYILPAMGYSKAQIKELEETINHTPCDGVIIGTPVDLRRFIKLNKPAVAVRYELEEIGSPSLEELIDKILLDVEEKG